MTDSNVNELKNLPLCGFQPSEEHLLSERVGGRKVRRKERFEIQKQTVKLRKEFDREKNRVNNNSQTIVIGRRTQSLAFVGDGLRVERAPGLGWAVKAHRAFHKNQFITQYEGTLLTKTEASKIPQQHQTHFMSYNNQVIDGLKEPIPGRGAGSFVNHSSTPNCRYSKEINGVFIVANRNIREGEWLTVDYGRQFLQSKIGRCHSSITIQKKDE